MSPELEQQSLFYESESVIHAASDREATRCVLDELFEVARRYRTTKEYGELLEFVTRFRFYAPFNAMLLHVQLPGATYVASPRRWFRDYQRRIKPDARPLVILQPMGPVMFVFDVSATEPLPGAAPLPPEVERPFTVRRGCVGDEYAKTVENAKRDGIVVTEREGGSQDAGVIKSAAPGAQ